ncbi:phosphoserine phosphatase SerB [Alloscardovia macacae]|uniref:phosphoserine phosphatase n=1 Tax=Alloscardovia macacae TaxID=1160091 RepID=A0A1Y2T2F3_9BIFI|nr:phosphoserine phosphatase SerB [Alloscardovia macacae]OTA26990.1 phosphoserine phosphatase SerB [Alloscardovia macacae]OTA30022.1 phosphoserine phosphatase SerB [Alloscardovia macacae]
MTQRLLVMDIDSTLIDEEVIDELGDACGFGQQISEITARAMNGEIDFAQALQQRVRLLKGLSTDIFDEVYARLHITNGARTLIDTAHARDWTVGVVSGGFHEVADKLVAELGIDYCYAHTLGTSTREDGQSVLDGTVTSDIVTKETKLAQLRAWARENDLTLDQTIAIGDGANDIPMIQAAGVGIAFCAKPVTRAAAPYQINERNLALALDIIDRHDSRR